MAAYVFYIVDFYFALETRNMENQSTALDNVFSSPFNFFILGDMPWVFGSSIGINYGADSGNEVCDLEI